MNKAKYYIYRFLEKAFRSKDIIVKKYRKEGMVIGSNVHIFSHIISSEPYLISIGNDSTISTNVSFLTHDSSVGALLGRDSSSDLVGAISIGNNCFVGAGAILLYGVSLPNRTIVAAGSVVTKSFFEEGIILGGNPARIVGRVDEYIEKHKDSFLRLHGLGTKERKKAIVDSSKKVVRR